jgi:hypothetical protein
MAVQPILPLVFSGKRDGQDLPANLFPAGLGFDDFLHDVLPGAHKSQWGAGSQINAGQKLRLMAG